MNYITNYVGSLYSILMYKCTHNLAPVYLTESIVKVSNIHDHATRQATSNDLMVPKYKTDCLKHCPYVTGVKVWNNLGNDIRSSPSLENFKTLLKNSLLHFM